jgi:hypothetical protein
MVSKYCALGRFFLGELCFAIQNLKDRFGTFLAEFCGVRVNRFDLERRADGSGFVCY